MSSRIARMTVALVAAVAGWAPAAVATPSRVVALGVKVPGDVVAVAPDGSVLGIASPGGLQVAGLDRSGALGPLVSLGPVGGERVVVATAADGAGALATPSDGNDHLALSVRPAGGTFAPLERFSPNAELNVASSLALGGGTVIAGAADQVGHGAILLRRPDGTVLAPIALPGRVPNVLGGLAPQVAVDGSGRGLVAWGAGDGPHVRVQVATLSPAGVLGPAAALPGETSDAADGLRVRVAADGRGAIAWRTGSGTSVAPVSTTTGVDLANTASTPVRGATAVQADGSAVIVGATRRRGRLVASVASRAAGRPFTRAAELSPVAGPAVALVLERGRFVAALASDPDGRGLHRADAITAVAGQPPAGATPLPVASTSQLGLAVAAPAGRPILFARARREIELGDGSVRTTSARTEPYAIRAGSARQAPVEIAVAARQHVGRRAHHQSLRVRLACRTACAYRVLARFGAGGGDGTFDVARAAGPGARLVDVPYQGPSGSHTTPTAFRERRRIRLTIAVDDAQGRERVVQRSVLIEP